MYKHSQNLSKILSCPKKVIFVTEFVIWGNFMKQGKSFCIWRFFFWITLNHNFWPKVFILDTYSTLIVPAMIEKKYWVCWNRTKAPVELTHIGFNGMSNRLCCPVSFASKMRYWGPVIWKVECIKVENIKISLLWCLDFFPFNYYSVSKQEGFKFRFNPKLFIKPKWNQIVNKFGSISVRLVGLIWFHLFIGTKIISYTWKSI